MMDGQERKLTTNEALQEWRAAARALDGARSALVDAQQALARAERDRASAEEAHAAARRVLEAAKVAVAKTAHIAKAAKRDAAHATGAVDDMESGVHAAAGEEEAAHERHREAQADAYERQGRRSATPRN